MLMVNAAPEPPSMDGWLTFFLRTNYLCMFSSLTLPLLTSARAQIGNLGNVLRVQVPTPVRPKWHLHPPTADCQPPKPQPRSTNTANAILGTDMGMATGTDTGKGTRAQTLNAQVHATP